MTSNLRDGTGARGKLCSQCSQDVSGKPVKLCRKCYATLCLSCAKSHRCWEKQPDNTDFISNQKMNDTRPFPIQAGKPHRDKTGKMTYPKSSTIPWWLAEEVYRCYVGIFGNSQSLEQLAKRGGFGREELLILLRHER